MTARRTILGPGLLTIDPGGAGEKALAEQVTNVKLVPKVKTGDPVPVLSGTILAGDREESFTLKGKMLPDFGEVDSVLEWLFTNRGKTMSFEFQPATSLARQTVGTLVVEATEIGGDVGKADEVDFEFVVLTVDLADVA